METRYAIRCQPKNNFASQQVGSELILINMDTGEYHSFNRVGAVIWETIGAMKTLSEIIQCVTNRFDVSPDKAKIETQQFIENLIRHGMLDIVE